MTVEVLAGARPIPGQLAGAARLELTLLGSFAARLSTGEPLPVPGRKAVLLIARLAVSPGEVHLREKLAGVLWSDRGQAQARASLRQELMVVRRLLAAADPCPLQADGERLWLDQEAVAVDVALLEAAARSGARADLERAAGLYRGPFLDGIATRDEAAEQWLTGERERLHLLHLDVLDRLLALDITDGAGERAVSTARALLAADPAREDTHRSLMRLLAEQGRPGLALRQFQALKDFLERELGVEPEPETSRLHEEIRARRATAFPPQTPASPAPAPGRPSIAVLPFVNISGDPEQEYFADGLTEDIITDLGRVSGLLVVARHTAFTFKNRTAEARAAARELGVDSLLLGSVQKSGDRLRISVQLVDGTCGGHLWVNRYDRPLADVFALQDEISCSVVEQLRVQLLPGEIGAAAVRSTANAEAYQYYLMGRSFFLQSAWGRRALQVARRMFARAVEIDPTYARAHAGIANALSYLACMGDPEASFAEILASAERALALQGDLAEAHAAKGLALYTAGRHGEADVALAEAVRLGPGLFEAHFFAARNARAQGRYGEAVQLFEKAAELQPDDFRALGLAVNAWRSLGRREEMLSVARRCLERVEAELAVHPDNAGALAFAAAMLVETGQREAAEAMAVRTARLDPLDSITCYNLACAYAGLGRHEAALDRLQQVFSDPSFGRRSHVEWMKHDSSLEPLRGLTGYRALVERIEHEAGPPPDRGRGPAVAVLAFEAAAGDGDQQYLADGIAEEVGTALSRMRSFRVIAPSCTRRYRGERFDPPAVGRELGVDYLLHGSVRRSGERIRIGVQLTLAASGASVWADRYDGGHGDVFDLQDRIAERTAGAIEPTILRSEIERSRRKRPDSLAAYDLVMRALPHMWALTRADSVEALRLAEEAVALDPHYARAIALAAWCHGWLVVNLWAPAEAQARADGLRMAQRAVALDADDPGVLTMAGAAEIMLGGDLDVAALHVAKAVALDPNSAWAWIRSGYVNTWRGQYDLALEHFERAARLSPFDQLEFNRCVGIALVQFAAGRLPDAIAEADRARLARPGLLYANLILAAAHAGQKAQGEARQAAREVLALHPGITLAAVMQTIRFRDEAVRARFADGLKWAGIA